MDTVSILFIVCFGRGFQYYFLDFAQKEEESWAVNFLAIPWARPIIQPEPVLTILKTDSFNLQLKAVNHSGMSGEHLNSV